MGGHRAGLCSWGCTCNWGSGLGQQECPLSTVQACPLPNPHSARPIPASTPPRFLSNLLPTLLPVDSVQGC